MPLDPEFDAARRAVNEARAARREGAAHLARARETLTARRAEVIARRRKLDPDDPATPEQLDAAAAAVAEAKTQVDEAVAQLRDLTTEFHTRLAEFDLMSDPREAIRNLNGDTPILLLPVRLETRYRIIGPAGAERRQLCVRIYPDDCAVDSFEPVLSESELRSARRYWLDLWRAGGVPASERAAWRGLVSSHGSGRAAWIIRTFAPLNPEERPAGAGLNDLILVIVGAELPSPAERGPLATYWAARWTAGDDAAGADAALVALIDAVGEARAAELVAAFVPANFDERPPSGRERADLIASVAWLLWPPAGDIETQARSWSRAPEVRVMPDRFILIGYRDAEIVFEQLGRPIPSPLVVGPDPNAPGEEQIHDENGDLIVPEAMRWMVDFDLAVEWGMGFVVNLSLDEYLNGFTRLVAVGVSLADDAGAGTAQLETLLTHHRDSGSGLALVPQGTPTNNTDSTPAGVSRADDPDVSFDDVNGPANFTPTDNWLTRSDGQALAEALGIDPTLLQSVRHSGGFDGLDARAMTLALWPATLGYMAETMLHPLMESEGIFFLRDFVSRYVSGRGALPAVRIGRQPYGILPTTAFDRLRWGESHPPEHDGSTDTSHYPTLTRVLLNALRLWEALIDRPSRLGQSGDPYRTLLDVMGLHPASVEFHQRYSEGLETIVNRLNYDGVGFAFYQLLIQSGLFDAGQELLKQLGYRGRGRTPVQELFFLPEHNRLQGPLVDDQPLSESERLTPHPSLGGNYIEFLVRAGRTSFEDLRIGLGMPDDEPPTALLYLMLRHALMLGYYDAALRLHERLGVMTPDQTRLARLEPAFVHVASAGGSESRLRLLTDDADALGAPGVSVADHVTRLLGGDDATELLTLQLRALRPLAGASTARLERAFVEHLDLCAYRLDAWLLGLVNARLNGLRRSGGEPRPGIYLGAYGWVEDLRPDPHPLAPATIPDEIRPEFERPGDAPLMSDAANAGYILAPSLNQGVSAAILRNGYISRASETNAETLTVNLSSERVRGALGILEGMRNGQSLGALLGYRLERGLHDRGGIVEVDRFIYPLRRAFPLRPDTAAAETEPGATESIAARDVIDGLRLAEHIARAGVDSLFTLPDMPAADPTQRTAIRSEIDRMLNLRDAVADLGTAESIHQAAMGNFDRAAGTLETYTTGNFPPEPEVVRTPRSGYGLTHRVGLHVDAAADPAISPLGGVAMTPRAASEPALNAWLAGVLPAPTDVACRIAWVNPHTDASGSADVTLDQLGLQPIDLVHILRLDDNVNLSEMDDRLLRHVARLGTPPRPDDVITIAYTASAPDKITLFALNPLVGALREILSKARPLLPADARLTQEAIESDNRALTGDAQPLRDAVAALETLRDDAAAFHAGLEPLLADPEANCGAILAALDTRLDELVELLWRGSAFNLTGLGWGDLYATRSRLYADVIDRAAALVARWDARLARFDQAITDYDALPAEATDAERLDLLRRAEGELAARLTAEPGLPAGYRVALNTARGQFIAARDAVGALVNSGAATLSALLTEAEVLPPLDEFDADGLDLTEPQQGALTLADNLLRRAAALEEMAADHRGRAAAALQAHDDAAPGPTRFEALRAVARALFGEDFILLPRFTPVPDHGAEWANALADPDLFAHLAGRPFPLDEWLYGVARVREQLRRWEQTVTLCEAFGRPAPELRAAQFPYDPADRWLGLEFPADLKLDRERLLYTAHYAAAFTPGAVTCGLLLDEWTEVVPARTETAALTFHYDRPNNEPPQTMLLVTPPAVTEAWAWADVVDALHDTLKLARVRAVEPAHLDDTPLAQFLPATLSAVTTWPISIYLSLAINNNVLRALE